MTKRELIARITELRQIQSNTRRRYDEEEWGTMGKKVKKGKSPRKPKDRDGD